MQLNFIQRFLQDRYINTNRRPNADELQRWIELDKINIYEPISKEQAVKTDESMLALKLKTSNAKITHSYNRGKSWSNRAKALGLTTKPIRDRFMKEKPSLDWLKDDDTALTRIEVSHYWGVSKWRSLPRYWLFEGDKKLNRQYILLSDIRKQENNIKKEFLKQTKKGEEMAKRALNQNETKLSDLLIQKIAIEALLKAHKDFISNEEFTQRVIEILEDFDKIKRGVAPLFCPIGNTKELYLEKTKEGALERLSRIYDPFSIKIPNFADKVTATLIKKGQEYTRFDNRISNFVDGANKDWFKISKKDYLFALAMKHLQYLIDNNDSKEVDDYYIEHAQDLFNYMLIYVACFDKFTS